MDQRERTTKTVSGSASAGLSSNGKELIAWYCGTRDDE